MDFADDFLEHILDRAQPRGPAVLVDHHRKMHFALLKVAQKFTDQFRFRNAQRFAQHGAKAEVARAFAEVLHQIAHIEDPNNVVEAVLVDRNARVADRGDLRANLRQIVAQLKRFDVSARRHHARHRRLTKQHRSLQQRGSDRINFAFVFAIFDVVKELFFRLIFAKVRACESTDHLINEADSRKKRPDDDERDANEAKTSCNHWIGRVPRNR